MPRAHDEPDWLHLDRNQIAEHPSNICQNPYASTTELPANPSLVASIDEISFLCRWVVHDGRVLPGKLDDVPQKPFSDRNGASRAVVETMFRNATHPLPTLLDKEQSTKIGTAAPWRKRY
jgi:hypothetical protein